MYIRITSFSYDPDREDELIAIADAARDEMKDIEGLQSIRSARVADGKSVTVPLTIPKNPPPRHRPRFKKF